MTDTIDTQSPEYQEAYQAAWAELDAKAGVTTDPATTDAEAEAAGEEDATEVDPVAKRFEELETKAARQEKALKDTQRAFHASQKELAALRKQREEEARAASRPALLDNVPGLEDAVRHVTQTASEEMTPARLDAVWFDSVQGALPDLEELLNDEGFEKAAAARRDELGDEWRNPIVAIRELGALRTQHVMAKAVEEATARARADAAKNHKELLALRVPGGSGRGSVERAADKSVDAVWKMTPQEAEIERQRVLGNIR